MQVDLTARAVLLAALVAGCTRPAMPDPDAPLPPRQAAGVFIEPPSARPTPRAVASARGVVSLTLPLSVEELDSLVHAYFRAFATMDGSALNGMISPGAKHLDDNTPLVGAMQRRFRSVDYSHLSPELVAFYDQLTVVPFEAAEPRTRTEDNMRPGDLRVDIPIRIQQLGITRLFGPHVVLVLHRSGRDVWEIAGVREMDGPWP